jgi:hypothetical protein
MGARARIEPQAVVFDLPAAEYHSDPCDQPSLTSSIAHALVSKSPLHAWNIHPRFGGNRSWQSREMGLGSVAHAMLLGTEHELVVIQADDWRAKIARDLRDAALAAGKVPVLQSDHDDIARAVKEIRRRLRLLKIKLCGRSEVSLFWLETADDGTVVQCRGRLDHLVLTKTRAEIFDLKSARSAHPKACSNHSFEYGYDIQQAAYRSALTQLYPQHAGREQFYFLFAELEPPYAVTTCAPAGSLRELGERRWRRAVNLWARCLKEKKWPGYAEGVVQLEAPRYALADEEELIYGSTSI